MPRYYREEPEEAEDYRPAFNRPPGAKPGPAANDSPRTPKPSSKEKAKQSPAVSPQKKSGNSGAKRKSSGAVRSTPTKDRAKYNSSTSTGTHSHGLSVDSLSKLNELNAKASAEDKIAARKKKEKQYKNVRATAGAQTKRRKKNRDVSGAMLEEGRWNEKHAQVRRRGGTGSVREYVRRRGTATNGSGSKRLWIAIGLIALLLIILIPVGVVLSKKSTTG
jgi:glucan 1,3-beta-glucosidase